MSTTNGKSEYKGASGPKSKGNHKGTSKWEQEQGCESDPMLITLQVFGLLYLPVADPGFSREGCANSQIGIIFKKNLPRTAWKWKNFDPRGASTGAPPLDPPMFALSAHSCSCSTCTLAIACSLLNTSILSPICICSCHCICSCPCAHLHPCAHSHLLAILHPLV